MSNEATQQRFFAMIQQYPSLSRYWDIEGKSFKIEEADHDFGALSSGEQVMLSFFRSVWFGKDQGFDLIRAADVFGNTHKRIIASWFADPFWP